MYEKKIYFIQDYICTHLDKNLSLEKLARIAAFSPFHFHRIFKEITGENLYDFIQRKRLENACTMLSSNLDMKIIDIALYNGFSTPSSFSKAFKNHLKVSPSEYRRLNSIKNSKNGTYNSNPDKDSFFTDEYITDNDLADLYTWREKMNVKIEELPEYRIAYMRQIGPYGSSNIQLMQKLKKWAITRGLLTESSVILGIAHDDPGITPAEKCRYDTCLVISDDYELENRVCESRLPGGKYGIIRAEHSAEAIKKAWKDIFTSWLPESGYQIDDRPVFERYTGAAIDITIEPVTCEICIPLKPE